MQTKNTFNTKKLGLFGLVTVATLGATALANAETYTVQKGDTLSAIAASHHTTVDKIAQKNKISNIHLISVGQVLELDDTTTSTATAESSNSETTTSGLSAEDAAAKEWIAQKESSGSYTAQNGQYYGRYQLTLTYLNGDLSPANQEKVANGWY